MQRYRVVILIVLFGIVPVAISFLFALSYLKDEATRSGVAVASPSASEQAPPPPTPPDTRSVIVAARALSIGTLIGDEDLAVLEIELDAVHQGYLLVGDREPADLLRGYAVREPIDAGRGHSLVIVGPRQVDFWLRYLGGANAR